QLALLPATTEQRTQALADLGNEPHRAGLLWFASQLTARVIPPERLKNTMHPLLQIVKRKMRARGRTHTAAGPHRDGESIRGLALPDAFRVAVAHEVQLDAVLEERLEAREHERESPHRVGRLRHELVAGAGVA